MQNQETIKPEDLNLSEMPVLTKSDATEYLAEILPQLANIANKSGLPEIGNMMELATGFVLKSKRKQ